MTGGERLEPKHLTVPRSARYYTLGGEAGAEEVWICLHGYSMLARSFIRWFSPAATAHRLIVAPEALNRYYTDHVNRKVGATWMTSEDRLAEIADYVRYLDLLLDEVGAGAGGPRFEVHAFSQATATACRWVAFGRVRPARLVLWAGGVPPDLDLADHGPALTAANLVLVLGDRDEFISEGRIADEVARLEAAGVRFDLRRFRGGHTIPWPEIERLTSGAS